MGKDKNKNNLGHFMKVEREIDNILRLDLRKFFSEFPQVEETQNSLFGNVTK